MIRYTPLWETLKRKKLSTYTLIKDHGFSKGTLDALILNSHKKIEKCSEWELRQTRRRTQMGWRPSRTTTQYGTIPTGTD